MSPFVDPTMSSSSCVSFAGTRCFASTPLKIQTTPNFAVRARRQLFHVEDFFNNSWHPRYVVLPDDQTLLMITIQEGQAAVTTVVVMNWLEGLGNR